jgi:hypothetical protein
MKRFTLLASLLMFITMSYAVNVIPVEDAMKASKNFLAECVGATRANQMELVLVNTQYSEDGDPVTYRFSVGNKGFIVASATDLANPILAFSLESNFEEGTGADLYMEKYSKDISYLMANPSSALNVRNSWEHYLASEFTPYAVAKGDTAKTGIEPLVTTRWTQEQYYNTLCPYNPRNNKERDDCHTPVGCIALTMANILFYYRYPEQGQGGTSIYLPPADVEDDEVICTYPMLAVNHNQQHYDYDAIANSLNAYDGELEKLIYNCGVSALMAYGYSGSSSNHVYALDGLQSYFSISDMAKNKTIADVTDEFATEYNWSEMIKLVKEELDNHRPVFYTGTSNMEGVGGHAWIVDGYTTIGSATYFHVNWGWAGSSNGYYLLNDQNTPGSGSFNLGNTMMVNLMPDTANIVKPAESFKRVTASFGTISDGAGNMKYAKNSNRRWVLACPDAKTYRLKFSKLKVKEGDTVYVYNGGTEASGIKAKYSGNYLMAACNDYTDSVRHVVYNPNTHKNDTTWTGSKRLDFIGEPLPAAITFNADSVLVVFTSASNSETDFGFVLDYQVTDFYGDVCRDKTYYDQHLVLTDKRDNLISDDPYRASNVCEYTLELTNGNRLVYVFDKYDLREGEFIDVYNQENNSTLTRIAHYDFYNQPAVGEVFTFDVPLLSIGGLQKSRFIIRFASDNMNQGTGFELSYYGLVTSINQYDNVDINVYPNPATNYINVEVATDDAQEFNASIVDMMGKTVYSDQLGHNGGTETYKISVNNLAKGIYFLHLNNANGKHVQKFIVK